MRSQTWPRSWRRVPPQLAEFELCWHPDGQTSEVCEHKDSMSDRRPLARPLAILVLLALLAAQLVASGPRHSDDHGSHCCPVCHASHVPLLGAAPLLELTPPSVRSYWSIAPAALPSLVDDVTSGLYTRGPPSLLAV